MLCSSSLSFPLSTSVSLSCDFSSIPIRISFEEKNNGNVNEWRKPVWIICMRNFLEFYWGCFYKHSICKLLTFFEDGSLHPPNYNLEATLLALSSCFLHASFAPWFFAGLFPLSRLSHPPPWELKHLHFPWRFLRKWPMHKSAHSKQTACSRFNQFSWWSVSSWVSVDERMKVIAIPIYCSHISLSWFSKYSFSSAFISIDMILISGFSFG